MIPIRKTLSFGAAFLAGAAATTMLGASVLSQPADPADGGMPAMDPAAMERWATVSTPGEQHAELASSAGRWNVTSKFWMDPAGEPETSQLQSVITQELGGRFVSERMSGEVMGMPYEGFGVFGYDNHKEKWTSIWMDNMGTAMVYAEGDETAEGTIELFGEMYDPMLDKTHEFKIVLSEDGPNVHQMAMFAKHDGEWTKGMEMTYRRAGRQPAGEHPAGEHPTTRPRR
jgi:hypothetical protein